MDYEAAQLENQHVHSVYESTAPYFNEVQSKAWPKVRQFLLEQKAGSLVVDIGCGTGKYLSVNCNTYNLGCDYCEPLVEIGRNDNLEVMVCDNLNLPFRDNCFDTVISIGVIHHFSTKQRRICAIKEMARILSPGGQMMLYVWAMEQKSRRFEKQDVFVPWNKALLSRRNPETNQCENKVNPKSHDIGSTLVQEAESINLQNLKQSFDTKQFHNTSTCRASEETCCMKFPNDDSRLYTAIGRSIRSWFFSRSLDESTLRRQIDKMKSLSPVSGWVNSAVSVQPSRHCSLDLGHQRLLLKEHSFDDNDDVFIKSESHKKHQWFLALDPSKNENGGHGLVRNGIKQEFQTDAKYCSCEGEVGTQHKVLKRTSTTESSDSILDETVAASDQEADAFDSKAYMRYYHVFREGELRSLLENDVPELSIISSSYDHGNWCIIAKKLNLIP
ncbi:probable tRNA methyltransferase 9B [Bufo gargarizans]|uniref:probable tRNA methyltransferase 9B n=1 Tax=Bufo gargarizans TaxID=30331 RepID=UPI001CF58987|nr:probable tRNA methyltransferase 9B [Bufo gargarizans]